MQLQRVVRVDRPIDLVFAYLADFTTAKEWDPGTVSCRRVSGEGQVGTTYVNTSRFMGRQTELTYVVQALETPHRITLRGENRTVVSIDDMQLRSVGDGTEVTYTATFAFSGVARYLAPLLKGPLNKLGDDTERGLRQALSRL